MRAFVDVPIIALFFLPLFAISIMGFGIILFRLPAHSPRTNEEKWRTNVMLVAGIIGMAWAVLSVAVEATQYFKALSGIENLRVLTGRDLGAPVSLPTESILKLFSISAISGLLIVFGIADRTKWEINKVIKFSIPFFFSAPLTAVAVGLLYLVGMPLGT